MATVTQTAMVRALVPNSPTTMYTVPSGKTAVITSIYIANTDSAAHTCTVRLDGFAIVPNVSIPANSVASFDMKQVVGATKEILAYANAVGYVNLHVSGVEIG